MHECTADRVLIRKAVLSCADYLFTSLISVYIVHIVPDLNFRCLKVVLQHWKTVPIEQDLVKEETTKLFALWLKHKEFAGGASELLVLFSVALPRRSVKSSCCLDVIITACSFSCPFHYELERGNWWHWGKSGQSGRSCDRLLPIILPGCWKRREDRRFAGLNEWLVKESEFQWLSGVEWGPPFTRPSVLARCPVVSNMNAR